MKNWMENFKRRTDLGTLLWNEPMAKHTTFRIGGPADLLIDVAHEEEVQKAVNALKEEGVPYMLLGNGSNLLVRDGGIRGAVVKLSERFASIRLEDNLVYAQAGASLTAVSNRCVAADLAGFEFASGIPGTVGGAMVMNAGAYGGEMKDIVKEVRVLDEEGSIVNVPAEHMGFGYRHSNVIPRGWAVLGVTFELNHGDPKMIREKLADFTHQRTTKQPLQFPSAGSTFKRPPGYFAGKLIDDAGLRGFRHGDAQVSDLHCGFVINRGKATCEQVQTLIHMVQKIVRERFGVTLETEVKIIGEEL